MFIPKLIADRKQSQVSGNSNDRAGFFKSLDLVLLLLVVGMVLFGLIMVYSSSYIFSQEKTGNGYHFIQRQLLYSGLGIAAMFGAYRLNYRLWEKWAYPVLCLAIVLLALIFVPGIGEKAGGARRWIHFGSIHFQPGEFAKFAIIFFVARQLSLKQDRIGNLTAGVLSHFIVPFPALFLLLMQPDFGTTVIISVVIFALMFLAGVPLRYLLGSLFSVSLIAGWLVMGTAYRRARLLSFLDPWSDPAGKGFQILQSFVGLHQGRLLGVGLGNGKEKLFYLPEAHNDFIFSVIGEELGFLGIMTVVLAYLYLIYRGLKIGWGCQLQSQPQSQSHPQKATFGLLLAAGITLALGLQGFVNISVVLGLLPTKGLTLPFISYGGSAILVDLFAVGVLLSISKGQVLK